MIVLGRFGDVVCYVVFCFSVLINDFGFTVIVFVLCVLGLLVLCALCEFQFLGFDFLVYLILVYLIVYWLLCLRVCLRFNLLVVDFDL